MITEKEIFKLMETLNINRSDKVTIHSSLRAIGEIENGADGLIDAFCSYLKDGLLIIPTHTWDNVTRENPFYDVKTTVPCIGAMARVAAFRHDAKRSLHPTHSVAVFGKNAADYIKGEELSSTPAAADGCLGRLYEENGKILLIGVGQNRNTYFHSVDERLNIPNRLNPDTFTVIIKDYDGKLIKSPPFHTHFSAGLPCCCSEFYPNYEKALEYCGAVTYAKLGNAEVCCCDARKATDTVAMLWEKADYDLCSLEKDVPKSYYTK